MKKKIDKKNSIYVMMSFIILCFGIVFYLNFIQPTIVNCIVTEDEIKQKKVANEVFKMITCEGEYVVSRKAYPSCDVYESFGFWRKNLVVPVVVYNYKTILVEQYRKEFECKDEKHEIKIDSKDVVVMSEKKSIYDPRRFACYSEIVYKVKIIIK